MSSTGVMSVALLVLLFGVNFCCASRALLDSAGAGHSLAGSRHSVVPAASEGEEIYHPVFYTYNSRYEVESKDGYDSEKYYGYRSKLDSHGLAGEVKDCGHGKKDDSDNDNDSGKNNYFDNNGHGSKDDGKKGSNDGHGFNVDDGGKKKGGCKDGHDSKDDGSVISTKDDDSYGESKNYVIAGDWDQAQAVPYKYIDYSRERP